MKKLLFVGLILSATLLLVCKSDEPDIYVDIPNQTNIDFGYKYYDAEIIGAIIPASADTP